MSQETVSALVDRRNAKRAQAQALHAEVSAIQRQIKGIEQELNLLDTQIVEAQQHVQTNSIVSRAAVISTDEDAAASPAAMSHATTTADEFLTDPGMTMTNDPDEHLTDPAPTQQLEQHNNEDDVEARDIEAFYDEDVIPSPIRPPVLEITRGNSITNHHNKKSATTTTTTLDHFFSTTMTSSRSDVTPNSTDSAQNSSSVALSSSVATRGPLTMDSLHALPLPQQQQQVRTASTVARMIPHDSEDPQQQVAADDHVVYPWSGQVEEVLKNVFQIESFRGQQRQIINCTMSGSDAFVIMRTGGGKSLTYQLPALLEGCGPERKVTLVVSPLLSLIQDQVIQMNEFSPGSAIEFTSKLGNAEHTRRWNLVRDRHSGICLVFVTPEKVYKSGRLKSELQKLYNDNRLGRFVIDECHCACQWGHDFRPDYTRLGILKSMFPSIPLMAVTATASDRVRHDVCNILKLGRNYQFFRSTANRPNLHYSVDSKMDGKDKVVDDMAAFIKEKHPTNAGIIYTFSRKEADAVASKLCDRGIVARSYHSSIQESVKEMIHYSWMRNETQVVVATIAFGLGINKPDVRFVLHHSLSKTLEAYYQESGRAGRDGKPADCILYYSTKDVTRMLEMIHGDNSEVSFWSMVRYSQASGNDAVCRAIILSTLGESDGEDLESLLELTTEKRNVGAHAKTVTQLLQYKIGIGENQTIPMLVKEWRTKPENAVECVQRNPPGQDINADECSRIIVSLMVEDILHPNVVYNSKGFSTMYLKLGPAAFRLLASADPKVFVRLPIRKQKKTTATPKSTKKPKIAESDSNGWISSNNQKPKAKSTGATTATKRKRSKSSSAKKPKKVAAKKKSSAAKTKKKKKQATKKPPKVSEIIELSSSSDESGSDASSMMAVKRRRSVTKASGQTKNQQLDIWKDPSDSEYEFE